MCESERSRWTFSSRSDVVSSSLLEKSSDCEYLDNISSPSVSQRRGGPWRSRRDARGAREGILLMSAGGIYFLFQHFRGLDVLHYSRQCKRHCNNTKQGFILTAQLFINLVLSATAYGFYISSFIFPLDSETQRQGELSICQDSLNRDALTSSSNRGLHTPTCWSRLRKEPRFTCFSFD